MNSVLKDKVQNNKDLTSSKKYEIQLGEQKYELQKKHIDELKQNNDEKVAEYGNDINSSNSVISTLSGEIESYTAEVERHQLAIASKTETESKVKKLTKLESQIESNLSKFQRDINFFQGNDNCPTCRQTIALGFKEEELHSLSVKVGECNHGLGKLEEKLLEEQTKLNVISEVQKKIQALQIKIATNNTSITETNKYIKKLEKMIAELKVTEANTEDSSNELKELELKLEALKNELKSLIDDKVYYDAAAGLLRDTGIKTKIIKQYLPIINKLVNKYLASFDFFVNFNLDESFKETIKSRFRDEFTYNNFSEGEKQRIDMALMLTWRSIAKLKNSSNTNLLILDEIFDSSLDTNGTEELIKILHMLEDVNLYVISHKGDILQDKFSNVIKFEKIKNFSRIVK
jgi:DNA repair exonuclease SbcCD ATPase subunit